VTSSSVQTNVQEIGVWLSHYSSYVDKMHLNYVTRWWCWI